MSTSQIRTLTNRLIRQVVESELTSEGDGCERCFPSVEKNADGNHRSTPSPFHFGSRLREIETPWLEFGEVSGEGRHITSYHHTVTDYFNAMSRAGLRVVALSEPHLSPQFAAKNPSRYQEAMRAPVYLIFKAAR